MNIIIMGLLHFADFPALFIFIVYDYNIIIITILCIFNYYYIMCIII